MKNHATKEIGKVVEDTSFTIIGLAGEVVVDADINELKEVWKSTLAF